jgi:3'-phosphoadenosine 5'-phosphosulfate sulfotransferase (PAPS reductase)/FAD synthetase
MEFWQLKQMQELPLEVKIEKTKLRIREWYEQFDGDVYVSYSGGKDSIVLLDIVRQMYPEVLAVFCDTGLEYPEIKDIVKQTENVRIIRPEMSFRNVIDKWGYPVVSKEQSQYIYDVKNTKSQKQLDTRLNGNKYGLGKVSEKWKYLLQTDIKISDKCCNELKKKPFKRFEKESCLKPILGIMANESVHRQKEYLNTGCNAFNITRPISRPIGFWTEQDILEYLKKYELKYPTIYGDIIELEDGKFGLTGVIRTGCIFCAYGVHLEKGVNKFQKLEKSHPKLHEYCIKPTDEGGLGMGYVLDIMGIKYKNEDIIT